MGNLKMIIFSVAMLVVVLVMFVLWRSEALATSKAESNTKSVQARLIATQTQLDSALADLAKANGH